MPSTGNTYVLQPGGLDKDWKFYYRDEKEFFVPALYIFGHDRQIIADYSRRKMGHAFVLAMMLEPDAK